MNKRNICRRLLSFVALFLFVFSKSGWADLSNTASTSYKDALNNSYSGTSNTVVVTVAPAPSLTLTKSANPTSVAPGGTVTFTIAYQNNGGAASNVVITDAIPTGSTLVAGSISAGGSVSGTTITWVVGNVAAGASGSVSFQVTAN